MNQLAVRNLRDAKSVSCAIHSSKGGFLVARMVAKYCRSLQHLNIRAAYKKNSHTDESQLLSTILKRNSSTIRSVRARDGRLFWTAESLKALLGCPRLEEFDHPGLGSYVRQFAPSIMKTDLDPKRLPHLRSLALTCEQSMNGGGLVLKHEAAQEILRRGRLFCLVFSVACCC